MKPQLVNYKDLINTSSKIKQINIKKNITSIKLNKFEGLQNFFINIIGLIFIIIGIYYLYIRKSEKNIKKEEHLKNIEKLKKLSDTI